MNCNRVRQFQVFEPFGRKNHFITAEINFQRYTNIFRNQFTDISDITIDDFFSVLFVDNAVANTELPIPNDHLIHMRCQRIYHILQNPIQRIAGKRVRCTVMCGRNAERLFKSKLLDTSPIHFENVLKDFLIAVGFHKLAVIFEIQLTDIAGIHLYCHISNATAGCLSEVLCQSGDMDLPTVNQVVQNTPGSHGRQLVNISNKNNPGIGANFDSRKQEIGQMDTNHAEFVNDNQTTGDFFVFCGLKS